MTAFDPVVYLDRLGLPSTAPAVRLVGGYTNAVWRVGDLVVKRYDLSERPELLGNDPPAEARALAVLESHGVAPELVHFDPAGPFLVYRFVHGEEWRSDDVAAVARALAIVHALPGEGFRSIPADGPEILADGDRFARLASRRPPAVRCGPCDRRLVHRDAGPGNLIEASHGVVLIDWQCPGAGDPAEDLAAFLSPAFQILYGREPLTTAQETDFLAAYLDRAVVERLEALRPAYDWRMAAYCTWRIELFAETRPVASALYESAVAALLERL